MREKYILLVLSLLFGVQGYAYNIIPRPKQVKELPGFFNLSKETSIQYAKSATSGATYLNSVLKREFGLTLKRNKSQNRNVCLLSIDPKLKISLDMEGYHLVVSENGVRITAASSAGLFYGIQSLRQLLVSKDPLRISVPCVQIEDHPAFKKRIFMLDEGRHFKGLNVVKDILEEMALLKMNTFHWHLTDDQGWRIEIKKYPLLTSIGGFRDSTENSGWDAPKKTFNINRHGGFYTQEQVKEIIRYAAERHIEIIPEIDMPGHSSSAIAAYPWLGTRKDRITVPGTWGVIKNSYDVADPRVRVFIKDVLTEVIALFPSKIIHIGGDEVDYTDWKKSGSVQQFMKDKNLASPADLQTWFTNDMSAFIKYKGRRMMGWNDILGHKTMDHNNDGGDYVKSQQLAEGTIVGFWLGDLKQINEAVKAGYEVVNAYHKYTYFNYNTQDLPLSKVYSFDPVPTGLESRYHSKIIGVSAQLWSEYVPTVKELNRQLYPRLAAIAEVGWTVKANKDYESFLKSLSFFYNRWKRQGKSTIME